MEIIKKGVDIACWQPSVDYAKLAKSVDFAMIRTGFGRKDAELKHVDTRVRQHVEGCNAHGIPYGFYHYSYADSIEKAVQEADFMCWIIEQVGGKPEYPLAIDWEDKSLAKLTPASASAIVDTFCRRIRAAGYYPTIYANISCMKNKLDAKIALAADLSAYDRWVAHWASKCGYSGERMGMWQYSNCGTVPGITGAVDLDAAYVDYPALIRSLELNHLDPLPEPTPDPVPDTPVATPDEDIDAPAGAPVFPTAADINKVEDSRLLVGDVELPTLIINGIMMAPVRAMTRLVAPTTAGVVWNEDTRAAEVAFGDGDDQDKLYDDILAELRRQHDRG